VERYSTTIIVYIPSAAINQGTQKSGCLTEC
jgi:hypothetical protein